MTLQLHLDMRCTGTEVVHDATGLELVSTVAGIHCPQHCKTHATFTAVFTRLHLAVNNPGIFTIPINVVDLRCVARTLQRTHFTQIPTQCISKVTL